MIHALTATGGSCMFVLFVICEASMGTHEGEQLSGSGT
jgi:hypothetical protein